MVDRHALFIVEVEGGSVAVQFEVHVRSIELVVVEEYFKEVRELGLKRRETVWSLSAVGAGRLTGAAPSTRGPEWTDRWCTGCDANCIAG